MLTRTLRELERNGVVSRRVLDAVSPHVEYRLTPLGQSRREALEELDSWLRQHTADVEKARAAFVE